jgi:hypothetical protein
MVSKKSAAIAMLAILAALAIYHVMMLAGVLPSDIAWAGHAATSPRTLVILEVVSLVVTLLFAALVAAAAGLWGGSKIRKPARMAMWVVSGYFVLNVVGNLASSSGLERLIFTPVSVILACLALRLALSKD